MSAMIPFFSSCSDDDSVNEWDMSYVSLLPADYLRPTPSFTLNVSHRRIGTGIIRLLGPPAVLCKPSYGAALPKPFRKARQYSLSSIQSQENKFSCSFLSAILCRLP